MNEQDVRTLVAGMSRSKRAIYARLEAEGPQAAFELAKALGRGDGLTKEIRALLREGLIQRAGTRWTGRNRAGVAYAVTPFEEIEQEREVAKKHRQTEQKEKQRGSNGHVPFADRRNDGRRMVKGGNASEWIRTRQRVLESFPVLVNVDAMTYWESVPQDEYAYVVEEVLALHEWCVTALGSALRRTLNEENKRKVEKLLATHGREPEEKASFEAKAAELRRRLL